jgi:rubrerythrin
MTREDRWIVSLDEIRAIRWDCPACQVMTAFALNQTIRRPVTCPICHAEAINPHGWAMTRQPTSSAR